MGHAGSNEEKYQKTGNSEGQIAPGNPLFLGKQGRMEQIDLLTHTTPLTHRTTEQLQALGLTLGMAQEDITFGHPIEEFCAAVGIDVDEYVRLYRRRDLWKKQHPTRPKETR